MKNTVELPSFEGVSAGNKATLRIPTGVTYHQIMISYTGVTLAQMKDIRVLGNGKPIQSYDTGDILDMMNQFDGRAAASGVIVIDFTRYGMKTRAMEELTAIGTGLKSRDTGAEELSTLTLEVKVDSAALAPDLKAKAIISEPRPLGLLRHVRSTQYTADAVGEKEISDLWTGHLYNHVYFRNGNINSLRIEKNRVTEFNRTTAENKLIQADGVRVPQTGVTVFDPTELGHGNETFETAGVQDLRFVLDMSATGQVPVIVESIAPLR